MRNEMDSQQKSNFNKANGERALNYMQNMKRKEAVEAFNRKPFYMETREPEYYPELDD